MSLFCLTRSSKKRSLNLDDENPNLRAKRKCAARAEDSLAKCDLSEDEDDFETIDGESKMQSAACGPCNRSFKSEMYLQQHFLSVSHAIKVGKNAMTARDGNLMCGITRALITLIICNQKPVFEF